MDKKLTFNEYIKKYNKNRYILHSNYIIDCIYCKTEYKLSIIKQHLKNNKRCNNIQNELKNLDNYKFIMDFNIFHSKINNIKKNIFDELDFKNKII